MIKEECGVFGIFDNDGFDCARLTYSGLFALQHRGQESCGIAVNNNREIKLYKNIGLVNEVFHSEQLDKLPGNMAIGHVRYSTTGETGVINAQPLVTHYIKGHLAMAHNGNLINTEELKLALMKKGAIFQTTSDTEVMLHVIAHERMKTGRVETALAQMMKIVKGSYSLIMMSPQKLIACRDPKGMRPLCLGKLNNSYVIASESCALDTVRAEFVRDIEPGEIIVIDKDGLRSIKDNCGEKSHVCVFEYIYFARSDSIIDGMSVYEARKNCGRILAETNPVVNADLVMGVPDSGIDAAIGYAEASGIPYGKGLVVNRYVGRTFIQPTQAQRATAVRLKINVLKDSVKGKKVVMVDDSIVRGTTSSKLVDMLREAGATEVHMRISSPPFIWPCFFGTDIPSRDQLLACKHSVEEIRQMIGADSLAFLPPERLRDIVPNIDGEFCQGCFSGKYPYEVEF